jgi:uncharacterized membrane protein YbhN (UPF0104 family)
VLNSKILKGVGVGIVALSIAFVVKTVFSFDLRSLPAGNSTSLWATVLLGSILYAIAFTLFPIAWMRILEFVQGSTLALDFREVNYIYARAHLAKYLPGNVMEFVSRNLLWNRLGWKHSQIAASTLMEILLLTISLLLLCSFLSYRQLASAFGIAPSDPGSLAIGSALIAGAIAVSLWVLGCAAKVRKGPVGIKSVGALAVRTVLLYALFAVFSGLLLVALFMVFLPTPLKAAQIQWIVGAATVSWLAGYLTPGSPGGIGVREAVLLALLSGEFGSPNVLVGATLHRIVAVLGDLLCYLIAWACRPALATRSPERFDPSPTGNGSRFPAVTRPIP